MEDPQPREHEKAWEWGGGTAERTQRQQAEPMGRRKGAEGQGGLWTPQLCQGLHSLLADGAGERIQWLLLDLPLDRGPQWGR